MRIISKFRDYYDFVGQVYRNEDPHQVVWNRIPQKGTFAGSPTSGHGVLNLFIGDAQYFIMFMPNDPKKFDRYDCYGIVYDIEVERGIIPVNSDDHSVSFDNLDNEEWFDKHKKFWWGWYASQSYKAMIELASRPQLNTIERVKSLQIVKRAPIVAVYGNEYFINPKLELFGFQRMMNAFNLYQEIEMWFTDGRFDKEIPNKLTDKEKILTHGFDTKISFRHPVK